MYYLWEFISVTLTTGLSISFASSVILTHKQVGIYSVFECLVQTLLESCIENSWLPSSGASYKTNKNQWRWNIPANIKLTNLGFGASRIFWRMACFWSSASLVDWHVWFRISLHNVRVISAWDSRRISCLRDLLTAFLLLDLDALPIDVSKHVASQICLIKQLCNDCLDRSSGGL